MKKITFSIVLLMPLIVVSKAQTVTSIAAGNWTNPLTWGTTPPMPGADVVINHAVVLDIDFGYQTGSITVNASGQLTGNTPMRALAISGGTLTVNSGGLLNISRIALFSGTVTNSSLLQGDSLFVATALTNNSNAFINANQFMINTGGNFINNGGVTATNFLNIASTTNSGSINSDDFMNSKSFLNASTGIITVANNFLNSDSLVSPAVFTNDGKVSVENDWRNTDQILGSGKFCLHHNTLNSGTMSGTFDFCDLSGGNIDVNLGTIASSITYCLFSCATDVKENSIDLKFSISPNPNSGIFTIYNENSIRNAILDIFNIMGEKVYSVLLNEKSTVVDLKSEAKCLYFYVVRDSGSLFSSGKFVVE